MKVPGGGAAEARRLSEEDEAGEAGVASKPFEWPLSEKDSTVEPT